MAFSEDEQDDVEMANNDAGSVIPARQDDATGEEEVDVPNENPSTAAPKLPDLISDDEAPGSPEIAPPNLNQSGISAHSGEPGEEENLLGELDQEEDASAAAVPSDIDFGIELPQFRPHKEIDPAGRNVRLCIKAIETYNFKSYYGRKILGPFDQKFTAIIGPNGCGKSNTIDALLFVFGFRSSKLRAHKLPELIHNSDGRKDCSSAKVTVHFAVMRTEAEQNEQVEAFSIGRSISKSNKSDYFLNGARATQHDVTTKLREHDVDLDHNRFLILQGEVEQISLMKPTAKNEHEEGMLQYLEDIIGTHRYKKPIEEFEQLSGELQNELEVSDAQHHRLRKDLKDMHPRKCAAERYLEREGECARLEHTFLQYRLHKAKQSLKASMMKEQDLKQKLKDTEAEMARLRAQEAASKDGQSGYAKEMKQLKKRADDAAAEVAELEKQKAGVVADLKSRSSAQLESVRHLGTLRRAGGGGEPPWRAGQEEDASAAAVPSDIDFGIELPQFRPHKEIDPAGRNVRLCIKAIETYNFKSYYGRKILGPFDQKFTAIIGPNGCGKSNTIDALLFVFGFRSSKLRAHKLPELIHNSDGRKDCSSAKNEQVEAFSIGRSISKSNKSDYFLNGARATQHDVTTKLREHDVDLDHNRFLILQGEVEQISLMKPTAKNEHEEGMLQYLEDIIGTHRYKKPIEEFEQLFGGAPERTGSVGRPHHRLRKDLKDMHPRKCAAERYLEREGECARLEHTFLQYRLHKAKQSLKASMMKEQDLKQKLKDTEAEMARLRAQEAASKDGQSGYAKEMKQLKKRADDAAAEVAELEKQKAGVVADLKRTVVKRVENEIKKTRDAAAALEEKRIADANRAEAIEESIPEYEKKVNEWAAVFTVAQNEVANSTKEFQVKKKKLETEKAGVVKDQTKARQQLNCKQLELESVRSDATKAEKEVEKLRQSLVNAEAQNQQLQGQQAVDTTRRQEVTTEIAALNRRISDLTNRKATLETQIRPKKERLNALNLERTQESRSTTRSEVIKELLRCKANGSIPGIIGRLGDLGAIDKTYEIAVSAAGGGNLDMLVVDTVQTSKLCLEHARRYGRGAVRMYVVEKIRQTDAVRRGMDARGAFPEREGLPRLFDLVRMEDPENVRPVFYYALRDALVTDNRDQGIRTGKRTKTVTLTGEIYDPNTMTGGQGHIEIRMGSQVLARSSGNAAANQAQATALEGEIATIDAEWQAVSGDLQDSNQQLAVLKRELEALTGRMAATAKNLEYVTKMVTNLPADLAEAETRLAQRQQASAEEVRLTRDVDRLRRELEKITAQVDGLTSDLAEVDRGIWGVRAEKVRDSEIKLKKWQDKLDAIRKELGQLTGALTGGENVLKTNEATIKKKEDQIAVDQAKIADLLKRQDILSTEWDQAVGNVTKANKDIKKKEESFSDLHDALAKIELQMEIQETKINDIKAAITAVAEDTLRFDQTIKSLEPRPDLIKAQAAGRPFAKHVDFVDLDVAAVAQLDVETMKKEIGAHKLWLEKTKVNLGVLEEYTAARKKYDDHRPSYLALKAKFSRANAIQKELTEMRTREFLASFEVIQAKLKKTYNYLTHGGDADLMPVNNTNIFGDGIEFGVRPPNKSWKMISNLSGGEKTLSSLSLIFALHHYKPTPFYIMDEIDAALDYRNVTIVGKYVKDRALDAQFIIISLRPNMYQQACRHIGIFKVNNVTQVGLLASDAYKGWQEGALAAKPTHHAKSNKSTTGSEKDDQLKAFRLKFLASISSDLTAAGRRN
ncbi:Structural maintenance of chromosomes protein 4 [Hypsibius exemplaris]|uniref:Structural maintenance of chromosomes protein 4 n=1 Tax=Hypsibius exemplaris TaxID=2072580 RepID=A0A1W0WV67_HYPEX|nr:Structural maintenance of chromosomes protein 4 [Hypsibius exemplaris]